MRMRVSPSRTLPLLIAGAAAGFAPAAAPAATMPDELDNLDLWLDGDNIDGANNSTLTDGQEVTTWVDSSNNGNAFNQNNGNASKQPNFDADGLNGRPSLSFSGMSDGETLDDTSYDINDSIDGPNNNAASEQDPERMSYTIFSVTKASDPVSDGGNGVVSQPKNGNSKMSIVEFRDEGGGDGKESIRQFMKQQFDNGNTEQLEAIIKSYDEANPPAEDTFISSMRQDPNTAVPTLEGGYNGNFTSDSNSDFPGFINGVGSFALGSKEDTGKYWDGEIAELIIYDDALTDSERQEIGFYLEDKYGLDTAYVPEPASLALLGLGGVAMLGRRRQR